MQFMETSGRRCNALQLFEPEFKVVQCGRFARHLHKTPTSRLLFPIHGVGNPRKQITAFFFFFLSFTCALKIQQVKNLHRDFFQTCECFLFGATLGTVVTRRWTPRFYCDAIGPNSWNNHFSRRNTPSVGKIPAQLATIAIFQHIDGVIEV